jgi:hypothetical protein
MRTVNGEKGLIKGLMTKVAMQESRSDSSCCMCKTFWAARMRDDGLLMCLHTGKRGGERIEKLYIKRMAAIGEAMQEGPLFKVSQSSRDSRLVISCGFYGDEQQLPSV